MYCIFQKTLPISECTVPFIIVGEWCYYLNETFLTYDEARDNCASANSHLAYITTEEEQVALESYLSGSGVESKHIFVLVHLRKVDIRMFFWVSKYFLNKFVIFCTVAIVGFFSQ